MTSSHGSHGSGQGVDRKRDAWLRQLQRPINDRSGNGSGDASTSRQCVHACLWVWVWVVLVVFLWFLSFFLCIW